MTVIVPSIQNVFFILIEWTPPYCTLLVEGIIKIEWFMGWCGWLDKLYTVVYTFTALHEWPSAYWMWPGISVGASKGVTSSFPLPGWSYSRAVESSQVSHEVWQGTSWHGKGLRLQKHTGQRNIYTHVDTEQKGPTVFFPYATSDAKLHAGWRSVFPEN